MGKVSLEINGRKYALGCDDGEEPRLEGLGRKLDDRIKILANQFGQIGDLRLLVMAAISMTDELEENRENLEGQARELSDEMQRETETALADAQAEVQATETTASDALIDAARQIERLAAKLSKR